MDELRVVLELATEDELQDLTEILFRRKFNPLDYLQGLDPVQVPKRNKEQWLDTIEDRFRFLAADGFTVLRGDSKAITYRQVLVRVCRHLKLKFSPTLSTTDLEAEIFLHLMERTWQNIPAGERQDLVQRIGEALQQSTSEPLPLTCNAEPLRLMVEGGSALAMSSVMRPMVLRQVARQFALYFSTTQSAASLSSALVAQAARQGVTTTALRYATTRSVFAVLSSALWVGFAVDLGWRAIATNYGRIIPIIFTLAQIRLTRSEWAYAV
jgi:uncharacterized protein YaaW (UPF0174 family)